MPRASGLYDAAATLVADHLLPPDAPDAAGFLSPSSPLRTRGEFGDLVSRITEQPAQVRDVAALAFLRSSLISDVTLPDLAGPRNTGPAVLGNVIGEAGSRQENGSHSLLNLFGEARVLGSSGPVAYSASLRNDGRLWRDHASFNTGLAGEDRGDRPDAFNGVGEAFATYTGRRNLQISAGWMNERWGGAYRGGIQVSDTAPPRPGLQVQFPFSLGHALGRYRFTQFQQVYRNAGNTVTFGGRRIEHPVGDRVDVGISEAFVANRLRSPAIAVLPYYAYQRLFIHDNSKEPNEFNYTVSADITVRPNPRDPLQRLYGSIVIDDIQAPKGLGLNYKVPRKIGYSVGAAGRLKSTGTDVVVEYMHADATTYTKVEAGRESLGWFYDGLPLAHPAGPNANELFVRLGQSFGPHWDVAVSGLRRVRVSESLPAPNARSVDASVTYHLDPRTSIGLRYSDYHEDPHNGAGDPSVVAGGEDYGSHIRRRIAAVDLQMAF